MLSSAVWFGSLIARATYYGQRDTDRSPGVIYFREECAYIWEKVDVKLYSRIPAIQRNHIIIFGRTVSSGIHSRTIYGFDSARLYPILEIYCQLPARNSRWEGNET